MKPFLPCAVLWHLSYTIYVNLSVLLCLSSLATHKIVYFFIVFIRKYCGWLVAHFLGCSIIFQCLIYTKHINHFYFFLLFFYNSLEIDKSSHCINLPFFFNFYRFFSKSIKRLWKPQYQRKVNWNLVITTKNVIIYRKYY